MAKGDLRATAQPQPPAEMLFVGVSDKKKSLSIRWDGQVPQIRTDTAITSKRELGRRFLCIDVVLKLTTPILTFYPSNFVFTELLWSEGSALSKV
eukprot:scaffold1513_cov100-Amphora_coffeaeformis.AAC.33